MISSITSEEAAVLGAAENTLNTSRGYFSKLNLYAEGKQKLRFMGIAVPPQLRHFELTVNWPGVLIDTVSSRQEVKGFYMPGEEVASKDLQEGWEANDLDAEFPVLNRARLTYSRGFLSVGANEENPGYPIIQVESPYEITVEIDSRHRRVSRAVRLYKSTEKAQFPDRATIYTATSTSWFARVNGRWRAVDRDNHNLGVVPLVPVVHGKRINAPLGTSLIEPILSLTDGAARALTNLQVAGEALAVPKRYVFGVKPEDFLADGEETQTAWEAYYDSMLALTNKDAKIGQLPAADLRNFHETVRFFGEQAAALTGFPIRYFGQNTANPPSADAIRAEEAQLVKRIEQDNTQVGNALGRVMGIYETIRTGKKVDGSRIRVEWQDPATPTVAQRADALQKLSGGVPLISREGAWDELGWSESRKAKERRYFEQQDADPVFNEVDEKKPE